MCVFFDLDKAMFASRTPYLQMPALTGNKNGPGDALLNQKRGADRSFVLATGFPRMDIKQDEQKNSTPEYAKKYSLFYVPKPSFWKLSRGRKMGGDCGQNLFCVFSKAC